MHMTSHMFIVEYNSHITIYFGAHVWDFSSCHRRTAILPTRYNRPHSAPCRHNIIIYLIV